MGKIMVAYVSRSGNTEKMAKFIAEGIRFAGQEPTLAKVAAIKTEEDLTGFDGFIFGCPTYHKDITKGMKQLLFLASKVNLVGKVGGAFGSHTHSGESAPMIYETMQHALKMDTTDLGPLNLTEAVIATDEGLKACQDYGKAVGQKL